MKRIIFLSCLIMLAAAANGQNCKIKIFYDGNGNRKLRAVECLRPESTADTLKDIAANGLALNGIQNDGQINFKVFPNPSEKLVNVWFNETALSGNCSINLTDMTGRILYSKTNIKEATSVISLDGYADGTYFVIMMSNKQKQTVKITKQTGNSY